MQVHCLLSEPIPTCADIKGTFPSAWRWYQLNRMKKRELKECVEFLGQDGSLDAEQRWALWTELRLVSVPISGEIQIVDPISVFNFLLSFFNKANVVNTYGEHTDTVLIQYVHIPLFVISGDKAKRSHLCISLQVYKPLRALKPAQVLELGCIITEMSVRELQTVNLSDLAVVANLGSFNAWNPRKVSSLFKHRSPMLLIYL